MKHLMRHLSRPELGPERPGLTVPGETRTDVNDGPVVDGDPTGPVAVEVGSVGPGAFSSLLQAPATMLKNGAERSWRADVKLMDAFSEREREWPVLVTASLESV